jgi:hypothetical protein
VSHPPRGKMPGRSLTVWEVTDNQTLHALVREVGQPEVIRIAGLPVIGHMDPTAFVNTSRLKRTDLRW